MSKFKLVLAVIMRINYLINYLLIVVKSYYINTCFIFEICEFHSI